MLGIQIFEYHCGTTVINLAYPYRTKIDFPVKMVDLCTKIPNFKAKYLQKSPEIAGILQDFF